jgi:alpha-2-macroglobulin
MKTLRLFVIFLVTLVVIPSVHAAEGFLAQFAGQQTVAGENAVAITFSKGLDTRQNIAPYLKIFKEKDLPVEGAWVLAEDTQVVYFTNVEPGTPYMIQIHKGLKSDAGQVLETGARFQVQTREVAPMISFGSKGFILASKLSRGLPVNTLNIPKADIDFFRVKPEFIGEFRKNFTREDQIYYYQSQNLNKFANLVYSGRWDLETKKNLRSRVNIPITHIKELEKPGIYFAVLKGAGVYEYGYSSTWFTISDLGLHVRRYPQSLQFQIQSLETAKPLKNVRVKGVDKKGKLLFNLTTDARGIARVAGAFESLTLVTATRKNHISLLPMDIPAMDLSEFKLATQIFRPLDLFVYGPRDIYRPGEVLTIDGLLRNQDGQMTPGLPIKAQVLQPDGRMVHEFTWKSQNLNYYTHLYHLPKDAATGNWRIAFTHGADKLREYPFLVAEFLPERMKLAIENPQGQSDILEKTQDLGINFKGDFLYGAPAFGSRADAMIHIKPVRELFKEDWPGYEFGETKNLLNHSFSTDPITLDEKGEGMLKVPTQWKEVTSPHWVTANASLYDSGGRPVVRNKSWQVWPGDVLVGIRSLTEGDIKNDSLAQFEVICVDNAGRRLAARGLKATVIKEQREYYWEFKNNAWQWGSTRQFYKMDQFSLDLDENKSGRVDIPVKWGGYRLEIANPATGLTTGYEIWAGWRPQSAQGSEMNRPDRVDLTLDKESYGPGDKVAVTVKAPEGGSGYLFVESSTNLLTLPLTIPPQGKRVEITIDPDWQRHDLYLSALIVRPGESRTGSLPKRSVGLVHLPLDRELRRLKVEIQVPGKIEPNRRVTIPVTVLPPDGIHPDETRTSGTRPGGTRPNGTLPGKTFVTLAAVDVGILNLTGFKTPSPFDYFFQPRQYGGQMYDLYQRLIESNGGSLARQRFGGDAPSLARGGDRPATDVQIVALHRQALKVDANGRADFFLDIPDFNGTLRLMAIAHTDQDFGSGDQELIVVSPLVTQITMPRFLSMGDKSQVALDLHNLTKVRQNLTVSLDAGPPITPLGKKIHDLTLEPNEKTVIRMPVSAEQTLGRSTITCIVKGLVVDGEDRKLERSWFLETRPAFPLETRAWQERIPPGHTFKVDPPPPAGTNHRRPGNFRVIPPTEYSRPHRPTGCLPLWLSGTDRQRPFPPCASLRNRFCPTGTWDRKRPGKIRQNPAGHPAADGKTENQRRFWPLGQQGAGSSLAHRLCRPFSHQCRRCRV